ncbi:DEAD/DEAH box helicase [Devosia sp. XJ19-1]|uniref:DEAD/DEAH box helicase n=1 Tax=Devosia ureilytica TaxID=2952754 RepID=A0A9Q4AN44_9HYPH|nr:DEAD/DEAH box helicase [Devosia ureilytica]MCP8883009.1 DEAD/DEAH box helicase [Devosia ureilytica]MCP8886623.1 DEAD/DEAH box helicase [Devosia ureilytica]
MRQLHDYQANAIAVLRQSLARGHKRPMLQAATGSGKTVIGAHITQSALDKGKRVCFTVPAISLIDQTVERFRQEGIDNLGVIQSDHPATDPTAQVQIASVQTLARRMFPGTDLVIVDEAHQMHKAVFQWMGQCPDLPFVGLSATPWTKGLGKYYDHLIVAATTGDLISRGFLAPFRVFAPSHPDLGKVRTVAGDYHEGDLEDAMSEPKLTADIVSTWLEMGENRPTLCFAVNRAHARKLLDEFIAANVSCACVDAYTDREERKRLCEAFNDGLVKVIVNIGTMTTGVDVDCRCIILARPTKSETLYVQIIGRGLRTAQGKADCLILDHSDTTLRLGFADQIHHDTLDDGRRDETRARNAKADTPKLPKECASCHYVKPAGVHVCPQCGFAPARREDVETAAGKLVQVAGGKARADHSTKQRFWSGLQWYCQQRGYNQGWASHKYREKFGVWPRGMLDTPRAPDAECANFVRAGMIRFAKAKQKQLREATNG